VALTDQKDPLDGFRKVERSDDERLEDEIRALHRLNEDGIDIDLLREVIKADQLVDALQGEKVMARLMTHITQRYDECTKAWSLLDDPRSTKAVEYHTQVRAARMVINWVQTILENGNVAQRQIEAEEHYE